MKILITGHSGFIGSSIISQLHLDNKIVGIDKLPFNNEHIKTVVHDLTTHSDIVEEEVKSCDIIIHLAGPVGVDKIDNTSDTYLNNMLLININIFNLVKKYNKKIIFTSTSEVYHEANNSSESDDLVIGNPEKSRWGYASGKLTSEFLCKSLCKKSLILRFFNITGKGDNKGVLHKMTSAIKTNKNIKIYGSGMQVRSFCDIRDAVEFIKIIMSKDIFTGEIYNVGSENNVITMSELASLCKSLSNKDVNIDKVKYDDIFSKNHDDILYRKPNCKKMNKIYKSKYNNQDIIESMLYD
tara:strand:+ start:11921 stop:12811 length:891 start_codon:yes stop_codon:yes gene_type:complete